MEEHENSEEITGPKQDKQNNNKKKNPVRVNSKSYSSVSDITELRGLFSSSLDDHNPLLSPGLVPLPGCRPPCPTSCGSGNL